jgi:hypothetical protein
MTATARRNGGIKFLSDHNAFPAALFRPLVASAQIGKGQFATVEQTYGRAKLNDGTTPYEVAAGIGDGSEMSDTSATAGLAEARLTHRFVTGLPSSTVASDGFTDADFCVPCWLADENTPGKLSHTGADATLANRPLLGLVFGADRIYGTATPVVWSSPIAWAVARGVLMAEGSVVASSQFTCGANTTHTESTMTRRNSCHGQVSQVRVTCDEGFTGHDTQYWTILVQKRTSTTPGTPVTVATATLKTVSGGGIGTITAFKYLAVTLGTGTALDVIEDDVFTVTVTSAGTSIAMTNFTVEVIAKVK